MKVIYMLLVLLQFLSTNLSAAECDEFFQGESFPMPKDTFNRGLVKLCQNELGNENVSFATLFSTRERIPVYTSFIVNRNASRRSYSRPSNLWKRVSKELCNIDIDNIPTTPMLSDITSSYGSNIPNNCTHLQAVNGDYVNNTLHLDRGHLAPSSTMNQSKYAINMTFILTNSAPQYHLFNAGPWAAYERYVREIATKTQ